MLRLLPMVIVLGIVLGGSATALGLLAHWFPVLEVINHFRPFLLMGAILLLLAAWIVGIRRITAGASVFFLLSLVLVCLPYAYQAEPARAGRRLKVVSLNVWPRNKNIDAVARFLEQERADVVILQEAQRHQAELIERVRNLYPHVYCPDEICSLLLLSRSAPVEVGKEDVPPRQPLLVWARVACEGRVIKVMGIHIAYPLDPEAQVKHVDWLIDYLQRESGPTAIVGDFNLSPFSWKMLNLLHMTGMWIHMLSGFSWPANKWVPIVLLDNVISTPDIGLSSIRIGPAVGSDHLPLIAEVAWR